MESPFKTPNSTDTRNAIDALLNNHEVPVKTTKVFGCSVKWSEKKDLVEKVKIKWSKEPVNLEWINEEGFRKMMQNTSAKLRLINFWSVHSVISTKEFPEFITINRMYRDRDFEFICISTDGKVNRDTVLHFLKRNEASNSNFLFADTNSKNLINSVKGSWNGGLPFTILVEPGGKIVYEKEGEIDPAELKKTIVNNHLLGRYP